MSPGACWAQRQLSCTGLPPPKHMITGIFSPCPPWSNVASEIHIRDTPLHLYLYRKTPNLIKWQLPLEYAPKEHKGLRIANSVKYYIINRQTELLTKFKSLRLIKRRNVYKLKRILFKSRWFKMAISWLTAVMLSTNILKARKPVFPTGLCIKQQGCLNPPLITHIHINKQQQIKWIFIIF